jgi:hypothetical protein
MVTVPSIEVTLGGTVLLGAESEAESEGSTRMNVLAVGSVPLQPAAPPAVPPVTAVASSPSSSTAEQSAAQAGAEPAGRERRRERPEPPPAKVLTLEEMRAMLGMPAPPSAGGTSDALADGERLDVYA